MCVCVTEKMLWAAHTAFLDAALTCPLSIMRLVLDVWRLFHGSLLVGRMDGRWWRSSSSSSSKDYQRRLIIRSLSLHTKILPANRLVHRNPGCVSLLLEEGPKETIEPAQQPREQARTLTAPDIPNLCVFLLSSVSLSVQGCGYIEKKKIVFLFLFYTSTIIDPKVLN